MTLPPLATPTDLATWTGETIAADDPRALQILRVVSAAIRREARQDLTLTSNDVQTLRGGRATLDLPQRPVVDVTAVEGRAYSTVAFPYWYGIEDESFLFGPLPSGVWTFDGQGRLILPVGSLFAPITIVTYSHGYATLPDDLFGVVLDAAGRAWTRRGQSGIGSEQIGTYRVSYTASGTLTLTADEQNLVRSYRVKKAAALT